MEFAYLFRVLLRRKWIIILCTAVAIISAYFFTKNMKYKFRSTAQISTGFTVSEEMKLSDERFNLPQIDLKFNNAIENITSRKVLSLLSYNLILHDLREEKPFTKLPESWKESDKYKNVNKEEAIKVFQN